MKTLRTCIAAVVVPIAIWSCGSDKPIGPGSITESGSNSLQVNADINGTDIGGGFFATNMIVVVRDSFSLPVNDAVVTINHGSFGTMTLPWDSLVPGQYTSVLLSYDEGDYTLNVTRGTDFISNARIFGPDIHSILYPTSADTLRQDSAFTVLWSRTNAADAVEIETRDYGPTLVTGTGSIDDGSFEIPASMTARSDQRIRIWRSNTTVLTTGWPGSDFEVVIRNSVESIVVQ